MDEKSTDKLLSELFKRNAPPVNEPALRERISARLWRRRKTRRRNRTFRAVALGFVCVVLAAGAAFGTYDVVKHFQSRPGMFFTDLTPPADSSSGTTNPLILKVSPVAGTAVLDQVKSEGTSDSTLGADGLGGIRGRIEVYRLSLSQPALNGTMEITSDLATRESGGADVTGSWVLRSDQGAWESEYWRGATSPNGSDEFYIGYGKGSGGFEGLRLILQWHIVKNAGSSPAQADTSETVEVSGWVQSLK